MSSTQSVKNLGPITFVDIDNAREVEQIELMKQIMESGECPFCLENLKKYHRTPVLKETEHWLLTRNAWPYDNTREHFLIILKTHKERLREFRKELNRFLSNDKNGDEVYQLNLQLFPLTRK